jgi:SAM-dependent methyltransferase
MTAAGRTVPDAAIWQDVEFGAYTGDLPLWEALAAAASGPVMELGAGTGRVSLHLARQGHEVLALERDPALVEELTRRSSEAGAMVSAIPSDVASLGEAWLKLGATGEGIAAPALAIAPLHLVQQISAQERAALLSALADLVAGGGRIALVVVDESSLLYEDDPRLEPRPPDMRDVADWVYSSEPLWLQVLDDEIRVRRIRKRVAPDGEIESAVHNEVLHRLTPEQLEGEAVAAGLSPAGRRPVASGPGEADSIAVLLEVPDGR